MGQISSEDVILFRVLYEQVLLERQEQSWNACIVSAENASINLCGLGTVLCFFFVLLNVNVFLPFTVCVWVLCRNNECPACRTHCASRRSLRDDPNYDALIASLYPDIDKYEEEVLLEQLWPFFWTIFYSICFDWNACLITAVGFCFPWRGEDSQ